MTRSAFMIISDLVATGALLFTAHLCRSATPLHL